MAIEQGLCSQVRIICRRDSDDKREKENTNKYNFPGKLARSRRWLDIDHEWLKKFSTHEPDLYKKTVSN